MLEVRVFFRVSRESSSSDIAMNRAGARIMMQSYSKVRWQSCPWQRPAKRFKALSLKLHDYDRSEAGVCHYCPSLPDMYYRLLSSATSLFVSRPWQRDDLAFFPVSRITGCNYSPLLLRYCCPLFLRRLRLRSALSS